MKPTVPAFVIFSALIIGTLFSAGCGWTEPPGYHMAHTLVLSKFLPDGSMDWSKTYDTLGDVTGYHIIQMPRGDYFISASVPNPEHFSAYQGRVLRIAGTGEVVSKNISSPRGCTNAPFITGNGNSISIGGQEVCTISPDGSVLSNISLPAPGGTGIQTREGGYLIAGTTEERPMMTKEEFTKEIYGARYSELAWNEFCINRSVPDPVCYKPVYRITVVKSDTNGSEIWRYQYHNGGFVDELGPVYESPEGNGYSVFAGYSDIYENVTNQQLLIRLTSAGNLTNIVNLSDLPERKFVLHNQSSGQRTTRLVTRRPPTLVFFDPEGNPVEKQFLNPDFSGLTQISDNEFTAMKGRNPVKFDSTGKITWEAIVPNSTEIGSVSQVIPTADGGVMVMSNIQKSSTTWP